MSRLPWYVTRASGMTAWALVLISIVWGLAMALPRIGFTRKAGPAWTLALHRWLGALALAFIAVHVGSILVDDFVHFSIADVVVPFASGWHPGAVAWGIVAMYLLIAVEVTSLVRKRLPAKVWRQVHLLAYAAFGRAFSGDRWAALVARGARVQRPLWASTSTKNPSYPDTLYVDTLIGPDTVNTIPDGTLVDFEDHGTLARTVDADPDGDTATWAALSEMVDFDDVGEVLEAEGVASFSKSFDELIGSLDAKATDLAR